MSLIQLPAVTLTDPWASLCVAGIKTLESRKGPVLSGFRGQLVIHRSKADCDPYDLAQFGVGMPVAPDGWPDDDRGMALGVVYVDFTWRYRRPSLFDTAGDAARLERAACFRGLEGRYLSSLTRAAWFPRPVPSVGKQGRWQIQIPREFLPDWAVTK